MEPGAVPWLWTRAGQRPPVRWLEFRQDSAGQSQRVRVGEWVPLKSPERLAAGALGAGRRGCPSRAPTPAEPPWRGQPSGRAGQRLRSPGCRAGPGSLSTWGPTGEGPRARPLLRPLLLPHETLLELPLLPWSRDEVTPGIKCANSVSPCSGLLAPLPNHSCVCPCEEGRRCWAPVSAAVSCGHSPGKGPGAAPG